MLGTYQQDAHFVDIYLDTTRHAVVDGTHYNLCHGWLGCVPYQDGITFGQLEKEILPQYFPVSCEESSKRKVPKSTLYAHVPRFLFISTLIMLASAKYSNNTVEPVLVTTV